MKKTWSVQNGLVELRDGDKVFHLSAAELYGACNDSRIVYKSEEYECASNGETFRFSNIVLNIKVQFEVHKETVRLVMKAIKGGHEFDVAFKDGFFTDYIIISNTWYSLGGDYRFVKDLVQGLNVERLSYSDYIKLRREIIKCKINFQDFCSEMDFVRVSDVLNINDIHATLYTYQQQGCKWLAFMASHHCGAILADEMGLGKTLQIISVASILKAKQGSIKVLVVSPVSLLENWSRECARFCPSLKTIVHYGAKRTGFYGTLEEYDLIITSYGGMRSDLGMLNMIEWDLVVLDEAQNIKNPRAQRTKEAKLLKRKAAIAVTGTPFENHITDLWSLVDFVLPGYFGKLAEFERSFGDDMMSATTIERFLSPIMLRRKVKDVAKDLPERVDIPIAIRMTRTEAAHYEAKRMEYVDANLSSLKIDVIQGLRMFCTHPSVYCPELKNKDPFEVSLKYQRLCEILEEVFSSDEKAIIFTSFNDMSALFVEDLPKRFGCYVNFINGSTKVADRQEIIDQFTSRHGAAVLILNPKAAGAGLNITAANHVFHYNLEWNPAIEDQASARAYRRGQERKVFVYRLYYANTIEDVINDRIDHKRQLMTASIIGNRGDSEDDYKLRSLTLSPYEFNVEDQDGMS